MASRIFTELGTLGKRRYLIEGSFGPNGDGAPINKRGQGFSVARVSTGLFRITFEDRYVTLESVTATLQLAAGADQVMQVGAFVPANKTLDLRIWDFSDADVADVAADENNRVHFQVVFNDSTVV